MASNLNSLHPSNFMNCGTVRKSDTPRPDLAGFHRTTKADTSLESLQRENATLKAYIATLEAGKFPTAKSESAPKCTEKLEPVAKTDELAKHLRGGHAYALRMRTGADFGRLFFG